MKILVLDIGGSHVKCLATGRNKHVEFESGPKMTPGEMVKSALKITKGWRFNAVSMGYPGVVRRGAPAREPHNLGRGWVGFDFQTAFGCPVRIINDAAMQALGGYKGGKMLFLGLGTGLGSALIVDGVIAAMELGHLHYSKRRNYEDYVGQRGRKRLGNKKWRAMVKAAMHGFRKALLPDYILLGGGNVAHLKRLPPHTGRGDNSNAFRGGFRLWEQSRSRKGPHASAR
jgi:polyphosphate glucokinase